MSIDIGLNLADYDIMTKKMPAMTLFLVLCFSILTFPLYSQTDITSEMVFAPFVSRITAEVRNNLIRLTWRDSPDLYGPVFVYRSNEPITGPSSLASIQPIEVLYGIQSYIDEIESTGTWYYFIAASDNEGHKYEMTIPLNNVISVSIQESVTELLMGEPYISRAEGHEVTREGRSVSTGISDLDVTVRGDSVIISFKTSAETNTPVLYRSTRPLRRTQDLLSAVMVQSAVNSPFVDYPVHGIPYYYAVVFEENLAQGRADIVPGQNATINAAQIAESPRGIDGERSIPIPQIAVQGAVPRAVGTSPQRGDLSSQAIKALGDISQYRQERAALKQPVVFVKEKENSASGGDLVLRNIVQSHFMRQEWSRAEDELKNYLSATRTIDQQNRARFYLGQSLYFQGKSRDALLEFLLIKQPYEREAAEWIQETMSRFLNNGQ